MLVVSAMADADVFTCPQVLQCIDGVCYRFPHELHFGTSYGQFERTETFYFKSATYTQYMDSAECNYVNDIKHPMAGFVLEFNEPHKPYTNDDTNNWYILNAGMQVLGAVYSCDVNAAHCPFTTY